MQPLPQSVQLAIGGLGTLAIFSILYKENRAFRYMEYIYVGLAAAHEATLTFHNYLKPLVVKNLAQEHAWSLLIPLALGLLVYLRFAPKQYAWVARLPISFWIGYNAGYLLAYDPKTLLGQITATFLKFRDQTLGRSVNNVLFVAICIATLVYFTFTTKRESRAMRGISEFARVTFMLAMGVGFSTGVMSRVSLFIGRVQYILGDWFHLLK